MSIQDRRETEKEKFMQLVLDAAILIMEEESLESVSIRKIASKIDYSPSLIYHYFKDKNDIINHILIHKYQLMNQRLGIASQIEGSPIEKFKNTLKTFILSSLENEKDFIQVMSSRNQEILKYTRVLYEGVSLNKVGFKLMINQIMSISHQTPEQAELTALVIWTSTFGLIMRLYIENVTNDYKNKLIDHHINYHIDHLVNIGKKA